ncbi:hypothetical protein BN1723_006607 [Verticillium longisporum]|uniref:Uncharacterized protein n=1 Tax=Verticillium longisporum TaxID=100787 RepID=A0A0G4NFV8_VERLO|nr:hypothetical protein BN1723_006607 [Verticillium longisporum]
MSNSGIAQHREKPNHPPRLLPAHILQRFAHAFQLSSQRPLSSHDNSLNRTVRDAAGAGVADERRVLLEGALCVLERGRLPVGPAAGHLGLGHVRVDDAPLGVNGDDVAVLDETDGAALLGLGHNVADEEAVAAAGEAAVGQQRDVLAEAGAHDGRARLEHLGHAGPALGALVADDDDRLVALFYVAGLERGDKVVLVVVDARLAREDEALLARDLADGAAGRELAAQDLNVAPDDDDRLFALFNVAGLERGDEVVLVVVDARLAREDEALLARDLADGAAGRELAAQDLNVARRLDGLAQRADDLLVGGKVGEGVDVLGHGLARDGDALAVEDALLEEELEEGRRAADAVHVGHDKLARGLEVGEEGGPVGDGLEVLDGELDADAVGNGEQVEDGVGAAAENVDDDHGVLKGLARQDVAGAEVLAQKVLDGLADVLALGLLGRVLGRAAAAAGQGETERLNGRGHGVGRVHATAGAAAGAGVADNVEALLLGDLARDVLAVGLEGRDNVDVLARDVLAVGLEGRDNVDVLALLGAAGLDGAAVDHDAGAVDAAHGHGDAGHVLVAAGQGNVAVVPLAVHDRLDAVGDDLTALQGVAHALGAHAHAVGDANRVEPVGNEAGLGHGRADDGRQVHEVHVAGVALVPDGGDADLGLVHVVFAQLLHLSRLGAAFVLELDPVLAVQSVESLSVGFL